MKILPHEMRFITKADYKTHKPKKGAYQFGGSESIVEEAIKLYGPCTIAYLTDNVSISQSRIRLCIKRLESKGIVEQVGVERNSALYGYIQTKDEE